MKLKRYLHGNGSPIGWSHWCPGCGHQHVIYVEGLPDQPSPKWTFNNDEAQPAFEPSVRHYVTYEKKETTICHYFVRRGDKAKGQDPTLSYINYQTDCQHKLNGQEILLPDFPEGEAE